MSREKLEVISLRMLSETQSYLDRKLAKQRNQNQESQSLAGSRSPLYESFGAFSTLITFGKNNAA